MIRWVYLLCLLALFPGGADASAPGKAWEFGTPGGNLIGINDIFKNQGVVIYDTTYKPHVTYISGARFYRGFIAGEAANTFFLFDEATHEVATFPTREALAAEIAERNIRSYRRDELTSYFNLSSRFTPLAVLLYMPALFLLAFAFLHPHPMKRRLTISGFLVVEGAVISAAALWLVLGLGGLFLSVKFAGYSFHMNLFVNLALLILCVSSIWLMLYLNEEMTQQRHPYLVNLCRAISFICFTVFTYWLASTLLTPSLPEAYWQGQY